MAEGNRYGYRLRVPADRQSVQVADEFVEKVVSVQFVEEHSEKRARPGEPGGACGDEPKDVRPQFTAPPFGLGPLFRPGGLLPLLSGVSFRLRGW